MKTFSKTRRPGPPAPVSGTALGDSGLYALLFGQARDSIIVLELPSSGVPVIRDANPAALALHGYSMGELVGKPITVLGASPNRSRFPGRKSSGSTIFEVRQKRRDGTLLVTEVTARNVRQGAVLYGILIERDITRRTELEEEGRQVSARIMLAREAEKKRLAASLHDAIGAMQVGMSSALLLVEAEVRQGKKRRAYARIAEARGLLKKVTSDLKGACVESWPPGLSVSGLGSALHELLTRFSLRSGISVHEDKASYRESGTESPLDIIIYRLAQEALNNAEKHSGAGNLYFELGVDSGWLKLSVRDDGRGFDMGKTKNKKNSLGLKRMAEAAESAGGYFSFYSKPGDGTLVKAELPIPKGPGTLL